jgi:glycerophosphoryl diester phosphodiesterase
VSATAFVIAHRGACGYAPEHSAEAYRLAVEQGADALEPDVVFSSDGVLVVRHDIELSASTNVSSKVAFASRYRNEMVDGVVQTGWFSPDFTWNELQELAATEPHPSIRSESASIKGQPLLRLADVLTLAGNAARDVAVVVEIKSPSHFESLGFDVEAALLRELELAGWDKLDKRLIIESFEVSVLRRLREVGIGAQHFYLIDEEGTAPDQLALLGAKALSYPEQRRMESLRSLGKSIDGISIPVSLFETDEGAALVSLCHDLGLKVFCWTLRAENKFLPRQWREGLDPKALGNWRAYFESILETGVDGVFADQPDLLVKLISGVTDRP